MFREVSHIDEIIVIRAADPDGSLFQTLMDALENKRTEVIHVAVPFSSVLRIGELEIHHEYRRVLMAGREVVLNHGEYAMLYCMASSPGQVFSKAQLYEAGRLRRKLEPDPRNPIYIKTVIGAGYKIEIPNNSGRQRR